MFPRRKMARAERALNRGNTERAARKFHQAADGFERRGEFGRSAAVRVCRSGRPIDEFRPDDDRQTRAADEPRRPLRSGPNCSGHPPGGGDLAPGGTRGRSWRGRAFTGSGFPGGRDDRRTSGSPGSTAGACPGPGSRRAARDLFLLRRTAAARRGRMARPDDRHLPVLRLGRQSELGNNQTKIGRLY